MDIDFKTAGEAALLKAMNALPRGMRNKAIRPALRAGGKVIKDQAVANVKAVVRTDESKGLLARSVVVRTLKQRGNTLGVAVAIGRGTAKNGARVGLYGSVLEHGKENQPPMPWLRPAGRQKATEAGNVVANETRRRLDEAVEAAKRGSP